MWALDTLPDAYGVTRLLSKLFPVHFPIHSHAHSQIYVTPHCINYRTCLREESLGPHLFFYRVLLSENIGMALVKAASLSSLILALFTLITLPASTVSWTLTSTAFNQSAFEVQPYVANGYIGQRIPVEGFGYKEFIPINATAQDGTNGWPLFDPRFTAAMVAGFYDQQDNTTGTNFVRRLAT
jgi:hypothetical protein